MATHVLLPVALTCPAILLLKTQALHTLLDILLRRYGPAVEFAKGNAAVLVVRGHLLPLFHPWNTGPPDGILWARNWRV